MERKSKKLIKNFKNNILGGLSKTKSIQSSSKPKSQMSKLNVDSSKRNYSAQHITQNSPCPQTPELKITINDKAQANESILDISDNKPEKIFQVSNEKQGDEFLDNHKKVLN